MAVDTLGYLLALLVTAVNEQDRAQVGVLAEMVHDVTGQTVEEAFIDEGDTGDTTTQAAAEHGIRLEFVKLPDAKKGFSCSHAAGSLSAVLAGWLIFVVIPVTVND